MLSLLSSRQFTPFYGCFKKNFVFSPFFSYSLKCQSRPKLDSNLSLATVLSEGRTNIFSFIFIVKVLSEAELSAISVKRKVWSSLGTLGCRFQGSWNLRSCSNIISITKGTLAVLTDSDRFQVQGKQTKNKCNSNIVKWLTSISGVSGTKTKGLGVEWLLFLLVINH